MKKSMKRSEHKKQLIAWNISYLEYLANGEVTFDQPVWKRNDY